LGRGLAALHRQEQPEFGFGADNYCGSTPQANPLMQDGWEFFARHRLLALAKPAQQRRLLNSAELRQVEDVAGRLADWIPAQPAVLLHGDLWSGNIHCDSRGLPALIDPACYWGWAEADLAMTTLFGGFDPRFYATYLECSGMQADWRERAPLYNLYHLLNHLLLFGGVYLDQVKQVLNRYARA
jgi:fructosamine-3-kinase